MQNLKKTLITEKVANVAVVAADYSEVIVYINMYFFEKISNL